MRTLGDMIHRIRGKIGDVGDGMLENPHVENAVNVAADAVCDDLMTDTNSRRVLRRYSQAADLVAEQEEYELPGDVIRVDRVEVRPRSDDRFYALKYESPEEHSFDFVSGGDALFGVNGGNAGGSQLRWFDDTELGKIRIWPALKSVNDEVWRVRYYARLPELTDYEQSYNDPEGDGSVTNAFPSRLAEAVEWAAVYELATDFGLSISQQNTLNAYYRVLRQLADTAHRTKPPRRYIKRIRGY